MTRWSTPPPGRKVEHEHSRARSPPDLEHRGGAAEPSGARRERGHRDRAVRRPVRTDERLRSDGAAGGARLQRAGGTSTGGRQDCDRTPVLASPATSPSHRALQSGVVMDRSVVGVPRAERALALRQRNPAAVSYTHLTLPTNREV